MARPASARTAVRRVGPRPVHAPAVDRRLRTLLLLLFLPLAPVACAPGGDVAAGSDGPAAAEEDRLAALADRYWEWRLETEPVAATYLGDRRYDDRLSDIGPEAREARYRQLEEFRRQLREIDPEALEGQDRLSWLALEEELRAELAARACEFPLWRVDPRSGPQVSFLTLAAVQRVDSFEDGRRMARRWLAMGPWVDRHVANLREGLERGWTPSRVAVLHVIDQLDSLLARPDSAWPLVDPARQPREEWSERERRGFRAALMAAVTDEIRPAMRSYRAFLAEEALSGAREDGDVGVHALPEGEACYSALVRDYTTLDLSAEEIHRFGLEENERIRREMAELGRRLFGTRDMAEIQRRLRTDPAMHFHAAEEILATAERATARARAAIPNWFGRLPEADIVVEAIPEYEAPYTTIAYYRQPAADGSRPGTYFVNTHAPDTRPRYEAEVLAFHEGIPGHHLQIAIAQQLEELPAFRRHGGATVFIEGWALYTERLSEEMGLYSGDLDRMGMLSFDAWRASRLVVDTGLHAFGWSRERAIDYMLENTLLARNNVENEVDRYITTPGQALAYKIGQRAIFDLRAEARGRLGERFDIRAFHDRVLENGAVTLPVLRAAVEEWVSEGGG